VKVFEEDLKLWVESSRFKGVFVLGSIMASPVVARESNMQ
jgi:hypothetical protein